MIETPNADALARVARGLPKRVCWNVRIQRRYDGSRATIDVYAYDIADARRQAADACPRDCDVVRVERYRP